MIKDNKSDMDSIREKTRTDKSCGDDEMFYDKVENITSIDFAIQNW